MKVLMRLLAAAAMVGAVPVQAATYLFTLTGDTDTASFVLDSSPTPDFVGGDPSPFFEIDGVPGSFTGSGQAPGAGPLHIGDVQFYVADAGGGFEVNDNTTGAPIFSLTGSQLFTGTVDAPTFTLGEFDFTNDFFFGPVNEHLSITAVPEPATWAMLVLGFGVVGFAMRRRRTSTTVRFA